ncbi:MULTISPECIES: hypothetical protein [Actinobacillus]|uniref:hypothetical protein n=1 Tax=Actinobacillus TaxID=713 RepID=UPI002441E56D|nr:MULTISPECIES: hypothetical protein [Actinobacillus]WGE42121.1 hypothetical protein NYR64_10450 [Actinobacillus equuli subsp. haemolyticus]WGE90715.1 hypothetical protein NYR63_07720 [Actinobacillus genomosp. 1]
MNKKSLVLEESIKVLKQLQMEQHDVMDNSQRQRLDSVIQELQKAQLSSNDQILDLIGKALDVLPWLAKLFLYFTE